MKSRTIAILLILLSTSISCKKTDVGPSPVPWVKVNITIDLSKSPYDVLLTPGGYVFIQGGYKGIVVVSDETGKIWALDRTCPYHVKSSCGVVTMSAAGNEFLCGSYSGKDFNACCASTYAIDGSIGHGPSKFSLKAYIVTQNANLVTITS